MKTKQIAAVTMLTDHAGLSLFNNNLIMRSIGRIAFPLFAYQLGKTWNLTSDKKKLSQRLLVWGLISQIPYVLMSGGNRINMVLGFWAIVEILKIIHLCKPQYKLIALILGAIGCEIAKIDYGWYGPIAVVMMMSKVNHPVWWFSWGLTNTIYSIWCGSVIQVFAIAAPALIKNQEEKPPSKLEQKFYYYLYPLHMGILAVIKGAIA